MYLRPDTNEVLKDISDVSGTDFVQKYSRSFRSAFFSIRDT